MIQMILLRLVINTLQTLLFISITDLEPLTPYKLSSIMD